MKTTPETDAIAKGIGRIYAETRGRETSTIEFVERVQVFIDDTAGKLERERDEWKASHDNQVNIRRALMDRPDMKERAELVVQMQNEIAVLRSRVAEYQPYADSALTTDYNVAECQKCQKERDAALDRAYKAESYLAEAEQGYDVYVERDQIRKVADELARRHASWMRNVPNFKIQLDEETQTLYSQLPHVKQKETATPTH
jgi:hypothetical protein